MEFLNSLEVLNHLLVFNTLTARILAGIFIILFTSSIGSFLNVVIYRVPIKKSIVKPGSYCPKCKNSIKWYHNIPVLSYIFLKGRCAYCGEPYSFRYCLVEFLTAFLAILFFIKNGYAIDMQYIKFLTFMMFGLVIIFIDFDHKLILDVHNYPLIALGLIFSLLGTIPFWQSVAGAVIGFVIFYLIALIYYLTKKADGLGGGDIKFITAVGAFTGIAGTIFVIFFSSFLAIIASIAVRKGKQEIAFGPYLVIAALLYFYLGDMIIHWYLGLFLNNI